jgi:hypothetical protein
MIYGGVLVRGRRRVLFSWSSAGGIRATGLALCGSISRQSPSGGICSMVLLSNDGVPADWSFIRLEVHCEHTVRRFAHDL